MFNKINIVGIVTGHLDTLRDASTGEKSKADGFLFLVIPLLVATLLLITGHALKENLITILLASYAILTGLLFNLLVLVFDLIRKEAEPQNVEEAVKLDWRQKQKLLKETFASISFCVLEGITLSVAALGALLPWGCLKNTFSFLVYAVTVNFALTLLMILKRIHKLLGAEIDSSTKG